MSRVVLRSLPAWWMNSTDLPSRRSRSTHAWTGAQLSASFSRNVRQIVERLSTITRSAGAITSRIESLAFLAGEIGQAIRLQIGCNQLQAIRRHVGLLRI